MPEQPTADPTWIPIEFDPREQRMRGVAYHGNTPFDVPFISQISGNLWQGGCQNGLILPFHIEHVISLYKWEQYRRHANVKTFEEVTMYDSNDMVDRDNIFRLATLVNECVNQGPTLVHCQAGLNRSGLIAGASLILRGHTAEQAIWLLRSSRSPAVLCNKTFEAFLYDFAETL